MKSKFLFIQNHFRHQKLHNQFISEEIQRKNKITTPLTDNSFNDFDVEIKANTSRKFNPNNRISKNNYN